MENEFNDKTYYELLLTKYLNGQCTESELKIISELLTGAENRAILPELLHRASLKFHSGFKMKKDHGDELWKHVSHEIRVWDRRSTRKNLLFSIIRIAASLVLILGVAYLVHIYFFTGPEVIYVNKTTVRGQRLTFQLSDGSKVKLNAQSTIIFPEKFDENTRKIQLSGEAFFEVKRDPNRPFIVSSGHVNTEVLGTAFNINAFPGEDIVVTVATGKVNVSTGMRSPPIGNSSDRQNLKEVILTMGQQAIYHISNKHLARREVEPDNYMGWKDGKLRFEETPLGEVAEILQRWYDVDIRFDNEQLVSCTVTSTFKSESIEDVLEELKFIFKLNYTMDDRNIVISGKGCE